MNSFKETYDKILDKAKKINKWYYILAAIAFVFFGTSIYFSQNSYAYQNEVQNLNEQIAELNTAYEDLDTEYLDYMKDSEFKVESLNATIEEQQAISDEYNKLSEEHANCQETINGLNAQITELQTQVQNLNSQIETLKAENASENTQTDSSSSYSPGYEETDSNNENSGTMVWVPESRGKYHSIPNCGRTNPNKATQMTKASAEALGIGPCSKCWQDI